ncbi:MAG TPA: MOSC domain-containing protein [Longimicrobiales bacterium]|nr:MOSC domain-containing protein [Longimicrobiales bacterium]
MGRLEAIWIKRARRGPMDPVEGATLVEDVGLEGNADQGGWRQVTLIEKEVFDALRRSMDPAPEPAHRRANLMVSGVSLADTRDRRLRVGSCLIRIRGETRPCERMDEACQGLREALKPDWRGGAFGVVVEGGELRVGDEVAFEDQPPPSSTRRRTSRTR